MLVEKRNDSRSEKEGLDGFDWGREVEPEKKKVWDTEKIPLGVRNKRQPQAHLLLLLNSPIHTHSMKEFVLCDV